MTATTARRAHRWSSAALAVSVFPWLVMAYRGLSEWWVRVPEPGGGVDLLAGVAIPVGLVWGVVALVHGRRLDDRRVRLEASAAVVLAGLLLAHVVAALTW